MNSFYFIINSVVVPRHVVLYNYNTSRCDIMLIACQTVNNIEKVLVVMK